MDEKYYKINKILKKTIETDDERQILIEILVSEELKEYSFLSLNLFVYTQINQTTNNKSNNSNKQEIYDDAEKITAILKRIE